MPAEQAFHRLLAYLDYPMHVVTAAAGGERSGCLVGFGTQVSIDPARYLICISEKNHTHAVALAADALGVHLLTPEHMHLAKLFGEETGDKIDKFERCDWHVGPDGSTPVIDGIGRWFIGKVLERHDLGDHTGFVLEPTDAEADDVGRQLGFQQAKDLEPGHDP